MPGFPRGAAPTRLAAFTKFRNERRTSERTAQPGCLIKGNINSEGARIYHLPGSSSYAGTRIDETRGERWFGTEEEARDAGWRPPR